MNLSQEQMNFMRSNEAMFFSTIGAKYPRTTIVGTEGIHDSYLVLDNAQMGETEKNVNLNDKVFILSVARDFSRWIKIQGIAESFKDGDLFLARKAVEKEKYPLKSIIKVTIQSIEDITD